MRITVLVDNNTNIDQYYLGEPAVSYYIEDGDVRLLFDAGYSDAAVRNASAMGIDLGRLTHIVLSHGHNDHTRGLQFLPDSKARLVAHSDCFESKFYGAEDIGAPFSAEEAARRWNCTLTKDVYRISDDLLFLGEVPRVTDFEAKEPIGTVCRGGKSEPDFLLDDSALVYRSDKGIFIITGCSHSGICNIVSYAMSVCADRRLLGVLGGFHLLEDNAQLAKTVDFLAAQNPQKLYPCHCVSLTGKARLMSRLPVGEVGVGTVLEL